MARFGCGLLASTCCPGLSRRLSQCPGAQDRTDALLVISPKSFVRTFAYGSQSLKEVIHAQTLWARRAFARCASAEREQVHVGVFPDWLTLERLHDVLVLAPAADPLDNPGPALAQPLVHEYALWTHSVGQFRLRVKSRWLTMKKADLKFMHGPSWRSVGCEQFRELPQGYPDRLACIAYVQANAKRRRDTRGRFVAGLLPPPPEDALIGNVLRAVNAPRRDG